MVRVLLLAIVVLFLVTNTSAGRKKKPPSSKTDFRWSPSKFYRGGALVWTRNNFYVARGNNKRIYPSTRNKSLWKKVEQWSPRKVYKRGAVVYFNKRIFRAKSDRVRGFRAAPINNKLWRFVCKA